MIGPILGVGELLFDCFPDGSRIPGGAPANFAFHCSRLGRRAAVVSRVGTDEPGEALMQWLHGCGLDADAVQRDSLYPTGRVDVTVKSSLPSYTISSNAAWDQLTWGAELAALSRSAAAVASGTLARRGASRKAIERVYECCRGVRYFDINLREPNIDAAMLDIAFAGATIAKLTIDELLTINETPQSLTQRYVNLQAVLVTRGADGAEWHDASGRVAEVAGVPVELVDTVGAGDAFGAAVVVGLLAGGDPARILREANEYAARVCQYAGATPVLR